ncbi:uncharacterized protein LOC111919361 isoform X1 [Lactuca sativa]|uniref:DUF1664 domain-containing protein n=1 Tax=Lactuca sativa TaxID=4236 RepID=A0A9R1XL51_LACSA|nr:uncharacterized protein LOC111919361 isoform X1 [Lactuca sativa]KAJ0217191.1 hypothetical protein LSAT_V11C300113510 [Lactuca sativa]
MALPLGKLTLIIGAGLVGSVLAKEGRLPSVYDVFSGASKVLKMIGNDDKPTSTPKRHSDSLMAQVNSLRQELQLLASNRPVTIVTTNGSSGANKYGVIIIVVVVGYGYVWWKGWKLPDMMFATKRSLSDATSAVAKQLDTVYSSLAATKRHLSTRIDRVDSSLDEVAELTAATKEEVSLIRGDTKVIALDVQSVHNAVYTLESKLSRIELKQDDTNLGVAKLLRTALTMEKQASVERIQGNPSSSSRPALELPQRTLSLPPVQIEELQPSPPVSPKAKRPLETAVSASGLKVFQEKAVESPTQGLNINITEDGSTSSRVFGRTFSGISSVFSRARPPSK